MSPPFPVPYAMIACCALWLSGPAHALEGWLPQSLRIGEVSITTEAGRHDFKHVQIDREDNGPAIHIEKISSVGRDRQPWHAPLWLGLESGAGGRLRGALATADQRLFVDLTIDLSPLAMRAVSRPVRFEKAGLQPSTLLPGLAGLVQAAAGALQIDASVTATDQTAALTIDDLGFTALGVPVERLNLEIDLASIWPATTSSIGGASLSEVRLGEAVLNVSTSIEAENGRVSLPDFQIEAGESLIRGDRLMVDLNLMEASGALLIEGLDLAALSDQLALPGLEVTGWLGGEVPFRIGADGQVVIQAGHLAAASPGVIRYRPDQATTALSAQDANLILVRQALENFRFRRLLVRLDGQTDGAMAVNLELAGANPDLLGGYPLEFNLNLDGTLAVLAGQAVRAYALPDVLAQRLLEFLDP